MAAPQLTQSILVVEDDPSIAELIAWALDDAGFAVRSAASVAEALRLCDQATPDLVVVDFLLPDGLGSDLICALRQRCLARVRAVVISAHPRAAELARSIDADACLRKPFDLDDFFSTVERLLLPVNAPPTGMLTD
ncbi:MAG: response regulator [Sphaerobacter sp.]|nr:response regulator [Sphaerobacter sp.]